MLLFALLVVLELAARPLPILSDWPARMRLTMALTLTFVDTDHRLAPKRYLPMMPPWPDAVLYQ